MAVYVARSFKWVASKGPTFIEADPNALGLRSTDAITASRTFPAYVYAGLASQGILSRGPMTFVDGQQLACMDTSPYAFAGDPLPNRLGVVSQSPYAYARLTPSLAGLQSAGLQQMVLLNSIPQLLGISPQGTYDHWASLWTNADDIGAGIVGASLIRRVVQQIGIEYVGVSNFTLGTYGFVVLPQVLSGVSDISGTWLTRDVPGGASVVGLMPSSLWDRIATLIDAGVSVVGLVDASPAHVEFVPGTDNYLGTLSLGGQSLVLRVIGPDLVAIVADSAILREQGFASAVILGVIDYTVLKDELWARQQDGTHMYVPQEDEVRAWARQEDGTMVPVSRQSDGKQPYVCQEDGTQQWR